jgi:hypothetical protein
MKTTLIVLIALLISISCFAQQGINYKAVIKDDLGNILANQPISIKFIISQGIGEETVYEEEHVAVETDSNGIIILNIGEGTTTDVFTDIDWSVLDGYTNLRTEIDITGGTNYSYLGVSSRFKIVPYAMLANTIKNQAFKVENNSIKPINDNDDFVVGSTQLDNTGSGTTRLFFDNFKGAFRAGYTNSDVWDSGNRGSNSFASGNNTKASGSSSVAMGRFTEATGETAMAFGDGSVATGSNTIAMGNSTTAFGSSSTAMGNNTMASGAYSTAMGDHTIASGSSSTAIGTYNTDVSNAMLMVGNGNSIARRNALTLLFNGNLGIGVDNPTARLQLNGQIKFGTAAYIDVGNVNNFDIRLNGNIRSTVDNFDNLGSSSFRYFTVYATNGTINTSDRRDKTNIATLDYGLKEVMRLQPVKFNWKNKPNTDKKLGLIAQDLYIVIPEVVSTHETIVEGENRSNTKRVEAERMGVYYADLIPVLIKAIQELKAENDVLRVRVEALEKNN